VPVAKTRLRRLFLEALLSLPQGQEVGKMNRPLAVEIFCGVGGMTLGFEQAGFDVVAAVDNDPINVEFHRRNFPGCHTIEADVRTLTLKQLMAIAGLGQIGVDALFGGPPCQGFSLIGKRQVDDERNQLVFDFARWIARLRPRYFVMENVHGLLVGAAKAVLEKFKRKVHRFGYSVVEPVAALDASHFGVPQRRVRAFVLGHRKDLPAPSYPKPERPSNGAMRNGPTVWDAIGDLPKIERIDELLDADRYFGPLGKPSMYAKVLRGKVRELNDRGRRLAINGQGLGGCLRTCHTKTTVRQFQKTLQGTYEPRSRSFRLSMEGVAPTIRAGTGPSHGSFTAARPIHPTAPRCITVREAARLHSFPDWFEFHATKWHGFRQIGNSVPPLLARSIAAEIIHRLNQLKVK
jgi:DNA (cytosine-5)-methyltransferase 1